MASDVVRASLDIAGQRVDASGRCLLAAWVDGEGRSSCAVGGDVSAVRAAMMADCAVTSAVRACEEVLGSVPAAKGLVRLAAMRALDCYGDGRATTSDIFADGAIRELAEELGVEVPGTAPERSADGAHQRD